MSLSIDVDQIAGVLLADGWHEVDFDENTSSFRLDAYEFIQTHKGKADDVLHGGGQGGICSTGAVWQEKGHLVYCPLTAILAVRVRMKNATPKKLIAVPTGPRKIRRAP